MAGIMVAVGRISFEQANQNGREVMSDKFDELAKSMAQSVTRRGALKKFGVGLAGIALASLGLGNQAQASPRGCSSVPISCNLFGCGCCPNNKHCIRLCNIACS
jgi:hypothetical protein